MSIVVVLLDLLGGFPGFSGRVHLTDLDARLSELFLFHRVHGFSFHHGCRTFELLGQSFFRELLVAWVFVGQHQLREVVVAAEALLSVHVADVLRVQDFQHALTGRPFHLRPLLCYLFAARVLFFLPLALSSVQSG